MDSSFSFCSPLFLILSCLYYSLFLSLSRTQFVSGIEVAMTSIGSTASGSRKRKLGMISKETGK